MASNTARNTVRSGVAIVFAAVAVFFAVTAAIAVRDGAATPLVIGVELFVAVAFGAMFHATWRRK